MESTLSSEEVTKEWLLANHFQPDGDKVDHEEYGRTVAGWDDKCADEDHCHILVSLKERAIYLEEYDDAGVSTQIVKITGFSRNKIRLLLQLFDLR